jgi:hypothetical protein
MSVDWSAPTTPDEVARRAGGRKRYNTWRKWMAFRRRHVEVARRLFVQGALFKRGIQAELARELNVSRSTICRDVAYLIRLGWPCPHCGAYKYAPKPSFVDDPEGNDSAQSSATPVELM